MHNNQMAFKITCKHSILHIYKNQIRASKVVYDVFSRFIICLISYSKYAQYMHLLVQLVLEQSYLLESYQKRLAYLSRTQWASYDDYIDTTYLYSV